MIDILELKTCIYCNMHTKLCVCPTSLSSEKIVSQILEKPLKRNKWVTVIYANITKDEYTILKDKLGTGGKYYTDKVELRGKVLERVKKMLISRGYIIV